MELKKGDIITISKKLLCYNSGKGKDLTSKVNYPMTITVNEVTIGNSCINFNCLENDGGWAICSGEEEYVTIHEKIKKMTVFKTKEILNRKVTICVNVGNNNLITAGYSITHPDDTFNDEISKKISLGRALKDKTNVLEPMFLGEGMDKKFILYSIADHIFNNIENGKTVINGIRN